MNEAKTKICLFMRVASSNVFEVTKIHDRQAIIMEYVKGINASLNMYSNA